MQKIIESFNAGIAFEPENEKAFHEALNNIVQNQAQYQEGCAKLAVAYDRKNLAADMLRFMQE